MNNEARPKFTGSYKKKRVLVERSKAQCLVDDLDVCLWQGFAFYIKRSVCHIYYSLDMFLFARGYLIETRKLCSHFYMSRSISLFDYVFLFVWRFLARKNANIYSSASKVSARFKRRCERSLSCSEEVIQQPGRKQQQESYKAIDFATEWLHLGILCTSEHFLQ